MFVDESKSTLRGSTVDTGFSDEEWTAEWERLKQDGIYEVNFGDFLLYGMYKMKMGNTDIFLFRYDELIEKKCSHLPNRK